MCDVDGEPDVEAETASSPDSLDSETFPDLPGSETDSDQLPPILPLDGGGDTLADEEIFRMVDEFIEANPEPLTDVEWADSDDDDCSDSDFYEGELEALIEPLPLEYHISIAMKLFDDGKYAQGLTELEQSQYLRNVELVKSRLNVESSVSTNEVQFLLSLQYIYLMAKMNVATDVKELHLILDKCSGSEKFLVEYYCRHATKIVPLHYVIACQVYLKMNDYVRANEQYKLMRECVEGEKYLQYLYYPADPQGRNFKQNEGVLITESQLDEGKPGEGYQDFMTDLHARISALSMKTVQHKYLYCCRWEECEKAWEKKYIYEEDIAIQGLFTGVVRLTCSEGCQLDYHVNKEGANSDAKNCWELFKKHLKAQRKFKKGFEFGPCITPDCPGNLWQYDEYDKNNTYLPSGTKRSAQKQKLETQAVQEQAAAIAKKIDKNPNRARPKSESKWMDAVNKGKNKTDASKAAAVAAYNMDTPPKSLSRAESPVPSVISRPYLQPIVPDITVPLKPLVKEELEDDQGFQEVKVKKAKKKKQKENVVPLEVNYPPIIGEQDDSFSMEDIGFGPPVSRSLPPPSAGVWQQPATYGLPLYEYPLAEPATFTVQEPSATQDTLIYGQPPLALVSDSYSAAAVDKKAVLYNLYKSKEVQNTILMIYDIVRNMDGRMIPVDSELLLDIVEQARKSGAEWAQLWDHMGGDIGKLLSLQPVRNFVVNNGIVYVPQEGTPSSNIDEAIEHFDEVPALSYSDVRRQQSIGEVVNREVVNREVVNREVLVDEYAGQYAAYTQGQGHRAPTAGFNMPHQPAVNYGVPVLAQPAFGRYGTPPGFCVPHFHGAPRPQVLDAVRPPPPQNVVPPFVPTTQSEENERVERERVERERVERERVERERVERERVERERVEREVVERQRLQRERFERERAERERVEREAVERERVEQEAAERERVENERLEAERAERERLEREAALMQRVEMEREKMEWEMSERDKMERQRVAEQQREIAGLKQQIDAVQKSGQNVQCDDCADLEELVNEYKRGINDMKTERRHEEEERSKVHAAREESRRLIKHIQETATMACASLKNEGTFDQAHKLLHTLLVENGRQSSLSLKKSVPNVMGDVPPSSADLPSSSVFEGNSVHMQMPKVASPPSSTKVYASNLLPSLPAPVRFEPSYPSVPYPQPNAECMAVPSKRRAPMPLTAQTAGAGPSGSNGLANFSSAQEDLHPSAPPPSVRPVSANSKEQNGVVPPTPGATAPAPQKPVAPAAKKTYVQQFKESFEQICEQRAIPPPSKEQLDTSIKLMRKRRIEAAGAIITEGFNLIDAVKMSVDIYQDRYNVRPASLGSKHLRVLSDEDVRDKCAETDLCDLCDTGLVGEKGNQAITNCCAHIAHSQCLTRYIEKYGECPSCADALK